MSASSESAVAEAARPERAGREEAAAGVRVQPPWVYALHLAVLWGFAVAQPVFDVMSESADFFVTRAVEGTALVVLVVSLAVIPPALLFGAETLAGLFNERLRWRLHLVFIWGLFALLALGILNDLFPRGASVPLVGSVAIGLAAAAAYARIAPVRSVVTVLGPAPVLFVVLFLLFTPAKRLAFPGDAAAVVSGVHSRTPVVMVVFDELPTSSLMDRSEHIDSVRYPNFERLAQDATWFRNTVAAADHTTQAMPAMLTGVRPGPDELPILADYPGSLFTLLGESHRVEAMEHASLMCPARLCPVEGSTLGRAASLASALSLVYAYRVVPGGLNVNIPLVGTAWEEAVRARDPKRRIDPKRAGRAELTRHGGPQFEKFLQSIERPAPAGARPPLYFLHSSLPHIPWKYLPSGKVYADFYDKPPGVSNEGLATWVDDDRYFADQGFQRHLLQTEFADRLLGRLLRRLRGLGLYDRSLIVVTADHGSSFRPGVNRRAVKRSSGADIGMVPLIVKAPGQKHGRIDDRYLQTIDVLPTMADVLGTRIPWRTDGASAFGLSRRGRDRLLIRSALGGGLSFDPSSLERLRESTLERKLALFGSGSARPGLYGLGGHHDILGKKLDALHTRPGDATRVQLEHVGRFRSVDLGSVFLPALVKGEVVGPEAKIRRYLAVAVNGRVRAIARTFPFLDQVLFSAVVPQEAFRQGHNDVRVLSVFRDKGATTLVPLRGGS